MAHMTEWRDPTLGPVLSATLARQGITQPIDRIEVEGLRDEPGFHWSNPGLKLLTVTVGDWRGSFVVKRLGAHARREVLVYRFLADYPDFPLPRLYHSIYDEENGEYWILMERCVARPLGGQTQFWEQCGLLLARIHAAFWDHTDDLPALFHLERPPERAWTAAQKLRVFLSSLAEADRLALDQIAGQALEELRPALEHVHRERLPTEPPPDRCLIHKSFHPPEIMWRETEAGYPQVAVDWETARVGAPQEDFRAAGGLLAQGEQGLCDVLVSTYLDELARHGIHLPRDPFWIAVRHEALLDEMATVPWLVAQFLRRRDDELFSVWCDWVVQEIPRLLGHIARAIKAGDLERTRS
ncbi:MAG: aminoglycoside phosphotransferase family protein [Anaerolineae bacterium]|nr:aminoglycoside phosphotransferase family protein [Anaerolineae bacterium]